MAKITIQVLVEGGKASAGPPLGPALGPLGINIGQVIADINAKTKDFPGLTVPVKVIVDKDAKKFEIEVGTPPVSALVKKELGIEKGAKAKDAKAGDIKLDAVVRIAKSKAETTLAKDVKGAVNEVLGTCVSMGVTCEGEDARKIIAGIKEGKRKIA